MNVGGLRQDTMKSFSLEKEMLESQVRKLQIENTRLLNENNILQNKYKRAQSRITFMEEQILHFGQDGKDFNNSEKSSSADKLAQQQIMNLKNQLDQLKSQNSTLELQLMSARSTASITDTSDGDVARIVEGFTKEIAALKEELSKARDLITQAEKHHQMEIHKSKEMASELKKLTELKNILQEEAHGTGSGCVAERLVRSLSERLKVTEDRLHYERADRAAKLSDVEEKLLKENARLQVAEKELVRQLSREKERRRNMETKMKEYREQVEKLQVSLSMAKPNMVNNKQLRAGVGSKKQKEDLNTIMEDIKRELNLGSGQETEIIWLLWQQREDLSKQLKELEMSLDILKVDHGSISKGLKALREEKELYEERLERYKSIIEDLKNEKEDFNNIYKQQVKELTDAKHQNHAKTQNLEDLAAALSAESEALKSSLMSGSSSKLKAGHSVHEAKFISLRHELQATQSDLSKHQRSIRLLQSQVESLNAQLAAKDVSIPALLNALQKSGGADKVIQRTAIQQIYKSAKFDEVDQTLSRDAAFDESDLHERDDEVFNISVAQKESEKELLRVQDDLCTQKSLVKERDREKTNPELKDAVSKAQDTNKDKDVVGGASEESANEPNSIANKESAKDNISGDTVKSVLPAGKADEHKEESEPKTLLDFSKFAKEKPPEDTKPNLPTGELLSSKPAEKKEVKKDPFFSLGVLARFGFGKKKPITEEKEAEKNKETVEEPHNTEETPKTEDIPAGGSSKSDEEKKVSEIKDSPESDDKVPASGEKEGELSNNKEVKKDSIFSISLLSRLRAKKAPEKKEPEGTKKEAEPSEDIEKNNTDVDKKEDSAFDEKAINEVEEIKSEGDAPKEETSQKRGKKPDGAETGNSQMEGHKPADISAENKPADVPDKTAKDPKKDAIFRVGLLARLGFGRKKPDLEKTPEEVHEGVGKDSIKKEIPGTDDESSAPVTGGNKEYAETNEPSERNEGENNTAKSDSVKPSAGEDHKSETEPLGKKIEISNVITIKDNDKSADKEVPNTEPKTSQNPDSAEDTPVIPVETSIDSVNSNTGLIDQTKVEKSPVFSGKTDNKSTLPAEVASENLPTLKSEKVRESPDESEKGTKNPPEPLVPDNRQPVDSPFKATNQSASSEQVQQSVPALLHKHFDGTTIPVDDGKGLPNSVRDSQNIVNSSPLESLLPQAHQKNKESVDAPSPEEANGTKKPTDSTLIDNKAPDSIEIDSATLPAVKGSDSLSDSSKNSDTYPAIFKQDNKQAENSSPSSTNPQNSLARGAATHSDLLQEGNIPRDSEHRKSDLGETRADGDLKGTVPQENPVVVIKNQPPPLPITDKKLSRNDMDNHTHQISPDVALSVNTEPSEAENNEGDTQAENENRDSGAAEKVSLRDEQQLNQQQPEIEVKPMESTINNPVQNKKESTEALCSVDIESHKNIHQSQAVEPIEQELSKDNPVNLKSSSNNVENSAGITKETTRTSNDPPCAHPETEAKSGNPVQVESKEMPDNAEQKNTSQMASHMPGQTLTTDSEKDKLHRNGESKMNNDESASHGDINSHHKDNPSSSAMQKNSRPYEKVNPGQVSVGKVTSGSGQNKPEIDQAPHNISTCQPSTNDVTDEITALTHPHLPAGQPNESQNMVNCQKEDYDVHSNDSETAAGINTVVHNKMKDDDSWPSNEEGLSPEEIQERREIMDEVHRLLSLEDEKDLQKEAAWIRYRHKGLVELDSSVSLSDIEEVDEYGDTDVDIASLDSEEMKYETLVNEQPFSGSPDLGFASPRSQYDPGSQRHPSVHGPPAEGDDSVAHDSVYSASMPTSVGDDLTVQPQLNAPQNHHPSHAGKPSLSDGDYDRPNSEQLDQLQLDLQRKSRSLDHINHFEAEQSLIIQTLQENLAAVNAELDDKNKRLKMKESYLEAEQKKNRQLAKDVKARDDLLSENIAEVLNEGKLTSPLVNYKRDAPKDSLSSIDAKTRLLEYERNTAQSDVKRAQESMEKIAVENTELLGRLRNMRQDLVKERATVCQLTSDKVEAEQKLRICVEERNNALREKQRLEQRLARHEATTMKTVQRLETEHQRVKEGHVHKYHTLDAEGKKLALELATAQRLLEAREKEIELLKTDVEHKSQEISNLERQLTIMKEEHQATRDEMDKTSTQLSHKMKEEASTAEVKSSLSNDKLRLELEKAQLQKEHDRLRQELNDKVREIEDLLRKHGKTDAALKHAESLLHQKETRIVGLEMEMKHANTKQEMLEEERNDLKKEVADLKSEMLSLNTDNTSLQNELHEKKSSLSEEKLNQGQILEKLSSASHKVELVKRDYDVINASLDHERKTVEILRDTLKMEEDKNLQLEAKTTTLRHELENANRQIDEKKSIADQYKKEKQVLYQDVQDLCLKLSEKDNMIAELQDKCDSTVETMHKDLTSEKSLIQQQREKLAQDLSHIRQELEDAKDKLRHKELQLQAYVHTNRHLEQETMHRQEAEKRLDKVEDELLQHKRQVSQLSIENKRLTDENCHLQEMMQKLEKNVAQLKDQLHQQRDVLMAERQELQRGHSKDLRDLHSRQSDMEEQLNRTKMELKSTKSSLVSAVDTKDLLEADNQNQEKIIEKLKAQLSDGISTKKFADQQVEEQIVEIADLKSQKRDLEDQLANAQSQVVQAEADLKGEKERHKKLKQDLANAKSSSTSHEFQVQALYLRIAELEGEVARLNSQAETMKQNLEGKNRRLALELKQLMETHDKERTKLIQQTQQLSQDLEASRETSTGKSRENLSLQEDIMNSDAKIRDLTTDLKRVNDELKKERDQRQDLEQKNHILQMSLIKTRPPGDGENDPNSESARLEVNKMMTDLSRSMQQQLEAQKYADKESRNKDLKSLEDFKKKIAQVESTLSQEQAMHMITKTQLDATNEDNTRLRHQLHAARKKHNPPVEDRSKSRIDEINELINRSQSRAQQLLASGMYGPTSPHSVADPLHIVTASRDFGAYSSVPVMMMTSPLSRSIMSDEILRASSPHDLGQK